ncbi:MAG TPA: LPS assembly lipoprotein LptE [Xanthobacteraceae bacterium]|jgi:LPS-assembly lipoprotein|nr:LPS assembly lipoprotein LptE [Xanthobacteraceae bacterium]
MWSRNKEAAFGRVVRLAVAVAMAGLVAGCFQPLYGDRPAAVSAHNESLSTALAAVNVLQIEAPRGTAESRMAVATRNALVFKLTGGSGSIAPTHSLRIRQTLSRSAIIVDITSGRTEAEVTGIDATFSLINLATGKEVVAGQTFSRVSSDVPGLQQRFARNRVLRDAEERATEVLADQIKVRLASYFASGT